MKKSFIIKIAIAVFLLLSLIPILKTISTYSTALKANWGISLPFKAKYKEIYWESSGTSFNGDGIRYHILSYQNEEYIDSMVNWSNLEKETRIHSSYREATSNWLKEIEVPKKYYPDFDECLYWYDFQRDNSEIIMFLNKQKKEIYIVESAK